MKIIALEAENLKRLTAVRIEPDGNLVQITGRNGQGKTSVLDSIWWALAGTSNVQTTPIRKGEERATITLDLGELKITRAFIAQDDGTYTTSIKVENGEGARFQSPQSMLDEFLGQLTFDPLAFARMKGGDKVHALRSLVPDFDFSASESAIKEAFEERTIANRDAKSAASAVAAISEGLPNPLAEPVEMGDLLAEHQKAQEHNEAVRQHVQLIETRKRDLAHLERVAQEAQEHEARIEAQLAEAKQKTATAMGAVRDGETLLKETAAAPEPIDTTAISARMKEAEAAQSVFAKIKDRDREAERGKVARERAEVLTANIEKLKAEAQDAIAGADLPIGEVSVSGGEVFLRGVPFAQASDAEQLQASIGIAMALNPTLKVIRVRDGSLLDDEAMKTLATMADENDYQIWIERVDSSGQVGFVLEDGHIKGQEITQKETPKRKSAIGGDTEKAE